MKKTKFVKITIPGGSHWIQELEKGDSWLDITTLDSLEKGEKATIEFVYLTEKEFEKLPEYEG